MPLDEEMRRLDQQRTEREDFDRSRAATQQARMDREIDELVSNLRAAIPYLRSRNAPTLPVFKILMGGVFERSVQPRYVGQVWPVKQSLALDNKGNLYHYESGSLADVGFLWKHGAEGENRQPCSKASYRQFARHGVKPGDTFVFYSPPLDLRSGNVRAFATGYGTIVEQITPLRRTSIEVADSGAIFYGYRSSGLMSALKDIDTWVAEWISSL